MHLRPRALLLLLLLLLLVVVRSTPPAPPGMEMVLVPAGSMVTVVEGAGAVALVALAGLGGGA